MSAIITTYKLILLREGLFPTHSLPLCNDSPRIILFYMLWRMQIPKQSVRGVTEIGCKWLYLSVKRETKSAYKSVQMSACV